MGLLPDYRRTVEWLFPVLPRLRELETLLINIARGEIALSTYWHAANGANKRRRNPGVRGGLRSVSTCRQSKTG